MNAKVFSTHTVRLCAGIFLLISLLSVNLTAAVRYVRQGGTGNGATWGNASGDLQAMINASGAGDQIWVAAGTYNNGHFIMKNGVEILGGFPNTGNPGLGNRDWIAQVTTLSGGSNVIRNAFTIGSPLTGTAVLDGFTITGGSGDANGGGMFNQYASPTVKNCVFSGNSALQGAGMYNLFASPTVTNCIFSGNICQGPGLQYGAGMANEFSSPTVTNCLFSNNVAGTSGSGMHNGENSNPLVLNCTFSGNTSNIGSAIYNRYTNSNPTIKNCIIWGNNGGIVNSGTSSTVTYSIVQGGFAGTGNLDINPLFVSQPPIGLGTTGDLQLQACSPAIDAGTSMGAPTTDILGNARVDAIAGGNSVDMGAYEYQSILQTAIEITSVTSTPIICQNDGSITAVGSATCQLVGTITYSINGVGGNTANTTGVFNGLPNGNYTVTVYDNGNPTNFDETTVTVGISAAAPVVTAAATAALCNGGNGQITLTVAGGTAPYDYVWNGPGANDGSVINVASHIIAPAPPGTYAITATDTNGCETTTSSIVTEPSTNVQGNGMVIADGDAMPSLSDHTDFGTTTIGVGFARTFTILNTGSAPFAISSITSNNNRFAVSGAPASVAANSSATFTVTFTPTATGAQNATITVNNDNCVYDFAVTGNGACPAITINAPTLTQPTCATPTGTIVVNATSSDALEYSVDNGMNWDTDPSFGGLTPGNYNIKVRLKANPTCEAVYGSNPVVLGTPFSVTTTDTWTGCVSTNWATPGNWHDGTVPTATDNVTIPNVTNDPVVSTAVVAKSVEVQANALLTIDMAGVLTINGWTDKAISNQGDINNNGTTIIGSTSGTGDFGVFNQGGFNNNAGAQLTIDRAVNSGIRLMGGTFGNAGTITIGGGVGGSRFGIVNSATFNNLTGGVINIDRVTSFGGPIGLVNISTFNNSGSIIIGANGGGNEGLQNNATFNNLSGGQIKVDRTEQAGVRNQGGTFTNQSSIIIGANGGLSGGFGVWNSTATLSNSTCAALIQVVSNHRVFTESGTFSNAGLIIENSSNNSNITNNTGIVQNLNGGTFTIGSGNPAITSPDPQSACCTPPTITTPTLTQPTCLTPTGTIVVNATGSGALEYSINNGSTWQATNTYVGQAPGNYNIKVRLQANPSCEATYGSNPVVLNSPFTASTTSDTWTGCVSTNWATPGNWADGSVPTAADDATIPNVANDPVISTAAVAGSFRILTGGLLTINAEGSLSLTPVTSQNFVDGTLVNHGTLTVTAGSNIQDCLYNTGSVQNRATGIIRLNGAWANGIWNFPNGNVTNEGELFIGDEMLTGSTGFLNYGTLINMATGTIHIDRSPGNALVSIKTVSNAGLIRIGAIVPPVGSGIVNASNQESGFINLACGVIEAFSTVINHNGSFINNGLITVNTEKSYNTTVVRVNSPAGIAGAYNFAPAAFGGSVTGISLTANAIFVNDGTASPTLGCNPLTNAAQLAGKIALIDRGTCEFGLKCLQAQQAGAVAVIVFNNSGAPTTMGPGAVGNQVTIPCVMLSQADGQTIRTALIGNTVNISFNQEVLNDPITNNGILAYPQGNPIPNVANNEIIIAPTTANACNVISPAFGLGSPVDFTIMGIFTNQAATMSAGTYVTATNTFTPTTILAEGTYTYYVKIADNNGGCTRIMPWQLTTEDCCDAPQAICKTATIALVGNSASLSVADVNNGSTADCGLQSITVSPNTFNCSHVGTPQTVTLTITDVNGISASCQTTVTVQDNTAPSITCPATQTLTLGANCTATLPNYTSMATTGDNCGVQGVTQSPEAGTSVSGAGNLTVTLTVTDLNGNPTQCSFTVTKVDQTPPTITCPATQTLVLGANCTATLPNYTSLATTGDNCGVQGVTQSPEAGTSVTNAGNMTVTLTVTDINGNPTQCNFTVTKVDNTPPTITCPATQTLALGANCTATLPNYTSMATTGDNCGVQGVTQSPEAGTTVTNAGNMTVTLTVTDINGNPTQCSFTVTKVDQTPPTITCPATQTLVLGANCTATLPNYTSMATTGDNCGVQGVTQSPVAGTTVSGAGNMMVTLTVTDVNGLTNTCTFTVTKVDNTAPSIICPTTKTLVLGANCTAALPNYTNLATTGDNCGVQSVTQSPEAGTTVSGTGNMTVTLTVTDVNGLTNSCTFTVTKMDETPPVVVCKNTTVFLNAAGNYTLLAADVFNAAASSDNCSGVLTVTNISPATVSCNQANQTIPVTVTVQDAAGNSATCTAQITVQEGTTQPEGWSSNNVGNANGSGGYKPCTGSNGQFTVSATGFSTSSADVLHLVSRQLCGNGEIIARVANLSGGGWAGVTLRESLAPGSKLVALKTQGSSNMRRMIRTTTNGAVNNLNLFRQHTWLRLVRNGSNFVGYTSTNGVIWDFAFSATVSMTSCIYAGLFAESINNAVTTTATFDNVQLIGGTLSLIQTPQTLVAASNLSPEVYPNPTTGEVNIDLSAYANPVGTVKIFDAYGKLVVQNQLDGSPLFRMKLDGDDGVYFLSIEVEGEAPVTKRVVIAH